MEIKQAKFVTGIVMGNQNWNMDIPQVAFYGRSNAGKSSSINALLNNKSLAKTSGVPGKTTEINLFNVNDNMFFLDLPGYGHARGSAEQKYKLQQLILWFTAETKVNDRTHVMVLDSKVGLTDVDETFLDYLYKTDEKIIILFNKIDKLNQKQFSANFRKIKEDVDENKVSIIPFSANSKKGVAEFWDILDLG
jgi:GTP-binding protein